MFAVATYLRSLGVRGRQVLAVAGWQRFYHCAQEAIGPDSRKDIRERSSLKRSERWKHGTQKKEGRDSLEDILEPGEVVAYIISCWRGCLTIHRNPQAETAGRISGSRRRLYGHSGCITR